MYSKRKILSAELQAEILKASYEPGCVISELAKRYGIRKERIYKWRKLASSRRVASNESKFVEAKLEEKVAEKSLKKACLEFGDLKLCIEGEVAINQIKQILELLC